VGSEIDDVMAAGGQQADEVLFQFEPGVIGADGDSRHLPSLRSAALAAKLLTVEEPWPWIP
jgi:hypothetical protein